MRIAIREQPKISEEDLQACLQDQYDLYPVTLEFLPLGLDYQAGVYRAVSNQGTAYLLKVTSRPLYKPACSVPAYLRDQGISAVVAPIPTKHNALWTKVADWTVIMYTFLDSDTSWTGMTNEQWQEVFFRDDLGEGTKADSVQLFQAILAEDGEFAAAFQTSTHLSADLTIPTWMISHIERTGWARET